MNIQPMDEASARAIARWRYDAPYDFYNLNPDEIEQNVAYFANPQNAFYSILSEQGGLAGYCSFGPDGQVPGGDYSQAALDVGIGMRPDLTGHGEGVCYSELVFDFACRTFAPERLRVTIAAFNQRAQRVCHKLGFHVVQRFLKEPGGVPFLILVREASNSPLVLIRTRRQ
ncbi:MAG: GNAT family N-acetyltransferase [Thermoflexales bacterium]|nr:GNAT family N-acetyltransferase [Thermoflexales bacterium]